MHEIDVHVILRLAGPKRRASDEETVQPCGQSFRERKKKDIRLYVVLLPGRSKLIAGFHLKDLMLRCTVMQTAGCGQEVEQFQSIRCPSKSP